MFPRIWALLCLVGAAAQAVDASRGIQPDEYRLRRGKVREILAKDKGILVLYGASEDERGDLRSRFFQEANFYYLTGWTEPGARLLLTATDEYLFLPPRNETKERYTGRKVAPSDANATSFTGFTDVLPNGRFEVTFFQKLETTEKLYALISVNRQSPLRRLVGQRPIENAAPLIFPLRQVKSPAELALIQRSIDVSIDAHRAAWNRATPGLFEYQVSATMTNVYFEAGCERSSYPPIVGSGPNSTILHYNRNDRRMDAGEVLLMDVAGECSMYAADITRTIPVNGKFSDREREIYNIVLGAQRAAIAAVKPGMRLAKEGENSLFQIAVEYMNQHGKSLKGEPIGKYFTHGLGHHVGLEVHDPGLPATPLVPGNVITIEPGLYIPEEGIGVRIEDMVLVTEDGSKVLTAALPADPEAIEQALHARKR
ncbi:MAG: aminopeptidase P N-terminal domain-containing protein [Acidobacteria bacterium]|nr:aminopeptidase P N-terminal domain-containing protein [Acidobacteriota bacterium]